MGPKNACNYADLAMGEIDFKAKFSGPIKSSLWWRYRDDVFDLWQQGLPALHQFTDYIYSLYPTIKFEFFLSMSSTYWILLYILSMGLLRRTSIPNLQTVTYIFHLPCFQGYSFWSSHKIKKKLLGGNFSCRENS